ncbi:TPA: hypothetical protein N0F65_000166 [Lagenidium giganteum]|uniref:BAR domain-containing protein n=1 Tax=Lagenidium giganteum TaxID=4803 RepID=A0AAV2YR73_9STRA|nr:TPA: hypothetical protein N0F65_000166 [Lagenidium giganteum]
MLMLKNMKDSGRRFTEGLIHTIGGGGDACMDPVLENRAQRFNRYNESLEKLAKAMHQYQETSQAHSQASVALMHAFSGFFEVQLQDGEFLGMSLQIDSDVDYAFRSLAQTSLRLEEIHQSLRANVHGAAHEMQVNEVARSIQQLRKNNAALHKQIQSLKQKLMDYDSVRRSAENQKKANTVEYEKSQQKLAAAEASLIALTTDINAGLDALDARRSIDMKNELLTVVACQLFVHARAQEHYQQLLPLLPGVAKPLLQVTEYARQRPRVNPGEHDTVGVMDYAGPGARGVIEVPLQFQAQVAPVDVASIHPLQSTQFGRPSACALGRVRKSKSKMNGALRLARGVCAVQARNSRAMSINHKLGHIAMPETAMLTNNGTHVFERKGWEYSAYMGMLGGPIILWLGLSNVPETDAEVFARAEAYAKRKGHVKFDVVKRPSGPIASQYVYERTEIGERPTLQG